MSLDKCQWLQLRAAQLQYDSHKWSLLDVEGVVSNILEWAILQDPYVIVGWVVLHVLSFNDFNLT